MTPAITPEDARDKAVQEINSQYVQKLTGCPPGQMLIPHTTQEANGRWFAPHVRGTCVPSCDWANLNAQGQCNSPLLLAPPIELSPGYKSALAEALGPKQGAKESADPKPIEPSDAELSPGYKSALAEMARQYKRTDSHSPGSSMGLGVGIAAAAVLGFLLLKGRKS